MREMLIVIVAKIMCQVVITTIYRKHVLFILNQYGSKLVLMKHTLS